MEFTAFELLVHSSFLLNGTFLSLELPIRKGHVRTAHCCWVDWCMQHSGISNRRATCFEGVWQPDRALCASVRVYA